MSDQGSYFVVDEFKDFLRQRSIKHIKIAIGFLQANDQEERVNRSFVLVIAKLSNCLESNP